MVLFFMVPHRCFPFFWIHVSFLFRFQTHVGKIVVEARLVLYKRGILFGVSPPFTLVSQHSLVLFTINLYIEGAGMISSICCHPYLSNTE